MCVKCVVCDVNVVCVCVCVTSRLCVTGLFVMYVCGVFVCVCVCGECALVRMCIRLRAQFKKNLGCLRIIYCFNLCLVVN